MTFERKLLALFCLAAVLCAVLSQRSVDLCWAILVPFLLVLGIATVIWAERPPQEIGIPALRCLPVMASRAPPMACPADLK